jgi:hypothetical protein
MDLAEFKTKWEALGTTEEGAIKCFLLAVLEHLEGNEEAEEMITMTLPHNEISSNVRYYLDSQFDKHVAGSYLGGTPDNEYSYSYDNNVEVAEKSTKRGKKKSKIFVQSGGKDLASPVHLRKNKDGYWKLFNVSSLATGVKPLGDPDDF